ncbi:putative reverse transcriptase domain-containing protein [Tanacetum coccineum]
MNDAYVSVLCRTISDHSPILLKVGQPNFGPKSFKVFDMWIGDDGFLEFVSNAWAFNFPYVTPDLMLKNKVKSLRLAIKNICRPTFSSSLFRRLSVVDANFLEADISMDEIKSAVWDWDGSKALGSDDFEFKFIKSYWEIIKYDFFNCVKYFEATGKFASGCCVYKVISKILASILAKVDFEMNFDSVNWNFLHDIMRKIGFGKSGKNRSMLASPRLLSLSWSMGHHLRNLKWKEKWRFLTEKEALWRIVIKGFYGDSGGFESSVVHVDVCRYGGTAVNEVCMPLITFLFDDLINSFGDNENSNDVIKAVSKVSLKFVYLAAGAGVAAFLRRYSCCCANNLIVLCSGVTPRKFQVMAAPIISISSEENVGSHAPRVILFGVIPAIIPEVPIVPADPIVTPEVGQFQSTHLLGTRFAIGFTLLCSDDSEADGESEPAEQRHVSSSHDTLTPLSEFPLALVVAPPGIRRRPSILVRPGEAIPFGRLYRTHLNGPRKLLTVRKKVGPIPARRLAWRRVSHHSLNRHSSPDSSSSSSPSYHSLSGHTPPDTTDANSSTPPRFVHRLLGLDSSLPFDMPSRKRCSSSTASVSSPTYDSRSIAPTHADLLPPRKRFRDLYSPEGNKEAYIEVDTADAKAVADVGISEGVVAYPEDGIGMGFEIVASDIREDDEEFEAEASAADTREIDVDPLVVGDSFESSRGGIPDLEDTIYDIVHYMLEVHIDRITEIETTQRQLEASQLVASGERASLVERMGSLRMEYLKVRAMLSIERDWIDSIRWHMALLQEEFCQVRKDRDDTRRRLRRLELYVERHLGFCP